MRGFLFLKFRKLRKPYKKACFFEITGYSLSDKRCFVPVIDFTVKEQPSLKKITLQGSQKKGNFERGRWKFAVKIHKKDGIMSQQAIENFWQGKLQNLQAKLEKNNFKAWIASDQNQAKSIFWQDIVKPVNPQSVSFGGSMTVVNSGLYEELKSAKGIKCIDTYDTTLPKEEFIERRRQGLLTDLFITSSNALTMEGQLVNLDGMGNRVAGLTFGPVHCVLLVGRNKVVDDLDLAVDRVKEYAAPVNCLRLNKNTPCTKTMRCEDCNSPDRICNTWVITEKSFPPERVKIILINEDLGY